MPIPLIVWGLGALATGFLGLGAHECAKDTNAKAQNIVDEAKKKFNRAKESFKNSEKNMQDSLIKFGTSKKIVMENSMKEFLKSYSRIKKVRLKNSAGMQELEKFSITHEEVLKIQKLADIYEGAFATAAGTATGTLIALAAKGSLGTLGSGAALTGITGALSLPTLGMLVGPMALFTGALADMKADENLEKARKMEAEANKSVEKMKTYETIHNAIRVRSEMFNNLLNHIDNMFSRSAVALTNMLQKKKGYFFGKEFSEFDFNDNELKIIAIARSLAGTVKAIIDVPIYSGEKVTEESKNLYDKVILMLPEFEKQTRMI